MVKNIIIPIILFILLFNFVVAEETIDVYEYIGDVEIIEESDLTPDNFLYFIDEFLEQILVGQDPEPEENNDLVCLISNN